MGGRNRIGGVALTVLLATVLALAVTGISMATARTGEPAAAPAGKEETEERTTEQSGTSRQEEPKKEQTLLYESMGSGTCAVAGIGACRESFVIIPETSPSGERVVRIAARAFYGCDRITAVQIPASVREIGAMAFANCKNLVFLSVSQENAYYTDVGGVLYTADCRTLIAYPAMRAVNPAVIPVSVTSIAEMAFYQCRYLTRVQYEGSAEAWERISIGAKNYGLTAAAVEFLANST